MQDKSAELVVFYILISMLIFGLAGVIVYIVYHYQIKQNKYLKNVEKLDLQHDSVSFINRLEIQENVLTKLSRDIHDNVGLSLTVAKMNIAGLLDGSKMEDEKKLTTTYNMITRSIDGLRKLSHSLNAEKIINSGLHRSIETELNWIDSAELFRISFEVEGEEFFAMGSAELTLFRVFQEAMQNIIKHSKAKNVTVRLSFSETSIKLLIQDDGQGFDTNLESDSSGLQNMKSRIDFLNGSFHVESTVGYGTRIIINLPIEPLNHDIKFQDCVSG